jgi:hypothetical protein
MIFGNLLFYLISISVSMKKIKFTDKKISPYHNMKKPVIKKMISLDKWPQSLIK